MNDQSSNSLSSGGSSNLGSELRDGKDAVRDKARELGKDAKDQASSLKTRLSEAGDEARADAAEAVNGLKERARNFAEERKHAGADQIDGVVSAIKQAAGDLEQQSPRAAQYVREAADGVQRFSDSVRDRSVDQIVQDATQFARRQPLLVFGGAALAGLAISRFLKSSSGSSSSSQEYDQYARASQRTGYLRDDRHDFSTGEGQMAGGTSGTSAPPTDTNPQTETIYGGDGNGRY